MRAASGVRILGPVSLEVARGSLVALMGPNGSGKSTLLRVLAGIARPSAGSATWDQQPTASAVRALGYVPQRESVHDRLTAREALRYAAYLRLDGSADIGSRVETVLDELGLAAQADTLIRSLSGGERRRAACGLELVGDPPVLLLDEPTSGLDEVLERRLMQLFRRLAGHDLAVLVLQAPVIGLLIAIVFHSGALAAGASPIGAVELVFLVMTGAIWLGVASAAREVVKERGLVEREFDVGIRLDAYVLAKALVLFALNCIQVLLLVLVVEALRPLGIGSRGVLELFAIAVLTAWASAAMGLAVSCAARSVDQAAGLVPLLLMPQLLLAGGLIPLAQMPRIMSTIADVIYARWAYAGLGSATHIGARLAASESSAVLGFDNGFFALTTATAAGILGAFIVVELLVAVLLLMRRPPV